MTRLGCSKGYAYLSQTVQDTTRRLLDAQNADAKCHYFKGTPATGVPEDGQYFISAAVRKAPLKQEFPQALHLLLRSLLTGLSFVFRL